MERLSGPSGLFGDDRANASATSGVSTLIGELDAELGTVSRSFAALAGGRGPERSRDHL